jgi:hypothetical protein
MCDVSIKELLILFKLLLNLICVSSDFDLCVARFGISLICHTSVKLFMLI